MKRNWKGMGKVFVFTFKQKWNTRRWRVATFLIAALLLLLPAGIMGLLELASGGGNTSSANPVTQVFLADETGTAPVDWNQLNALGTEGYTEIQYTVCDTPQQALQQAEQVPSGAVLLVEQGDSGLSLTLLRPENAAYDTEELSGLEQFLSQSSSLILAQKAGLDASQLQSLSAQVESTRQVQGEDGQTLTPQQQQLETVRMVFSMALPFVLMMALYFMVLFYGQGVANNVLMEKKRQADGHSAAGGETHHPGAGQGVCPSLHQPVPALLVGGGAGGGLWPGLCLG